MLKKQWDVVILGAGAAGLFCAALAGARGRKILVVDHAAKPAQKIRISGGGRCNFTNLHTRPEAFLSQNPHFCKSALARYTPGDFIKLIESFGISWHEKNPENGLGQLFCDGSAQEIIDMLLKMCDKAGIHISLQSQLTDIKHNEQGFSARLNGETLQTESLVVACGGKSIPKMGASGYGYEIARAFGLPVIDPEPALVPLTFAEHLLSHTRELTGVSVEARVTANGASFNEGLLFTHRGLSGPSILQISSYWQEGTPLSVNLARKTEILSYLKAQRETHPKQKLKTALEHVVPAALLSVFAKMESGMAVHLEKTLAEAGNKALEDLAKLLNDWQVLPQGSEGYRTAEVTKGGVDTNALSSKTMEAKSVPGLFFIGEVVDVTGWLGGYNFQWAWASAHAAAEVV
ncbi:MAG: NAD(P)/FAD-dependent oxidoreductase [Pseudobdellovibrionaceae bacterium]